MKRLDPRTTENTLLTAIGLLLLYGTVVVVWGFIRVEQRSEQLARIELDKTIAVASARLDRALSPVDRDLEHEAAFVALLDTMDPGVLIPRWAALLEGGYAYRSIRLADEAGNELALIKQDTSWLVRQTIGSSMSGPPLEWRQTDPNTPLSSWSIAIADTLVDPRGARWYGLALGNTRPSPMWTEQKPGPGVRHRLLVASRLVRSRSERGAFQVIALEMHPGHMADLLGQMPPGPGTAIVVDAEGDPIQFPHPLEPADSLLLTATLDRWRQELDTPGYQLNRDNGDAVVEAADLHRNGLGWVLLAVVREQDIRERFVSDRRVLFAGCVLLACMAATGIWAFTRQRREAGIRRSQERRHRERDQELAKALGERAALDREVHHRVKNNLQVVSSLLNLQAMRLADGRVKEEFMRGKQRIDSMALVHHRLYALQDLRSIDLQRFFEELITALLARVEDHGGPVSHEVRAGSIKADADTAIQLGIILSELVINSHQHAFPHRSGGHVEVQVEPVEDDLYRFVVRDNGVGLGDRKGPTGDTRLGLEIVEALAEQLDGSLHVTSGTTGTAVEVLFRMKSA